MSEHDRSKSFFPSMGKPSYATPDPPKVVKPRAERPGVDPLSQNVPAPPLPTGGEGSGLVPEARNCKTGARAPKGGWWDNINTKTGVVTNKGRNLGSILRHPNGFMPGEFPKDYRPVIESGYRRVGKRPPKRTRP